MINSDFFRRNGWWQGVALFATALSFLIISHDNDFILFASFLSFVLSVLLLLIWATSIDRVSSTDCRTDLEIPKITPIAVGSTDLEARVREAAQFKAELDAKRAEIAALKSGLNRTDAVELNEAIAQLYVGLEFERGRADGEFAQILSGLSESVDALFSAAGLVKGVPTSGERFIDQPAGSCKVFNTELTSDAALKGTIKAVRSPWVGFMANGKLKVITASNVSVYA
jgi:hypothetical protein